MCILVGLILGLLTIALGFWLLILSLRQVTWVKVLGIILSLYIILSSLAVTIASGIISVYMGRMMINRGYMIQHRCPQRKCPPCPVGYQTPQQIRQDVQLQQPPQQQTQPQTQTLPQQQQTRPQQQPKAQQQNPNEGTRPYNLMMNQQRQ